MNEAQGAPPGSDVDRRPRSTPESQRETKVDVGRCRSCGEEVAWLRHQKTGNPAPIELAPAPDGLGNIRTNLDDGTYRVLGKAELETIGPWRKVLSLNHFSRCPQAGRWHKR